MQFGNSRSTTHKVETMHQVSRKSSDFCEAPDQLILARFGLRIGLNVQQTSESESNSSSVILVSVPLWIVINET